MPAMWETWVQFLGWEDPLEKGKATHSGILVWRIPCTLLSMGSQRVGHDWAIFTFILTKSLEINKSVASLVAQSVKNLPAVQKTQVQSLGWEDPLENEMATHSSILAWIPWTEEPGRLQSMGLQRAGHNWATNTTATTTLDLEQCLQLEDQETEVWR